MASGANKPLRALEFYAGAGGFHFALLRARINAKVVGAFDLNPVANSIYRHNFPSTSLFNRNISGLTSAELDSLEAHVMHMSPPCQPFTRQGLRRDREDHRTDSFFHLMQVLQQMDKPPSYLLLENVQGFENSLTREQFVQVLKEMGYSYQEFLLTPTQMGVPNSRLRYYLLAKKKPLTFGVSFGEQPSRDAELLIKHVAAQSGSPKNHLSLSSKIADSTMATFDTHLPSSSAHDSHFLLPHQNTPTDNQSSAEMLDFVASTSTSTIINSSLTHTLTTAHSLSPSDEQDCLFPPLPSLETYLQTLTDEQLEEHLLPHHILTKYALALDIVQPTSTHCCCFTRGYGHYAVGTGSVIQSTSHENLHSAFEKYKEKQKAGELDAALQSILPLRLRYFTLSEIASLMQFPPEFEIPECVSVRQSYRVLGNSLNVRVVSVLLLYLLSDQ